MSDMQIKYRRISTACRNIYLQAGFYKKPAILHIIFIFRSYNCLKANYFIMDLDTWAAGRADLKKKLSLSWRGL